MLKHVQISPLRNRSDSVSLRSSTSCSSSICGSPEPPSEIQRTPSRASSYSSLNEQLPQTTIKVFTSCLKIDIEYKTLGIQWDTTSKEVIGQLLRRLKMRHRDPRLFYLSMEVSVRRAGVKTILVLDDDTRPAILQACHPKGESRFCLQLRPGGLIRVHTSALQPTSQYKSLVISDGTSSDELLALLLSCYNSMEPVEQFSIYEVCPGQEYQRKLHPDDLPLRAQAERMKRGETCHFLVRRNPNYPRRRQLLTSLNEYSSTSLKDTNCNNDDDNNDQQPQLLDMSTDSISDVSNNNNEKHTTTSTQRITTNVSCSKDIDTQSITSSASKSSLSSCSSTSTSSSSLSSSSTTSSSFQIDCKKCRNSFKSCEFCHKNSALIQAQRQLQLQTYNPVYNIREIRTVGHCFSSLGNDKKLLDIHLNGRFESRLPPALPAKPQTLQRPQSMVLRRSSRIESDLNGNSLVSTTAVASSSATSSVTSSSSLTEEMVNNDPQKGLGHFVYI
ncbi:uncharacterized protein LOC129916601 isoform X1 [Episyrphus balteatus]|uniref:uncharacterized protein LOC129916601 isoform X1 n=2 Tax=Episyrphus balteatus TaxID=286459 RepID=UPI002486A593|nr:uncharacterized protein LOC129916601 isoform X1 [Episyrphus balteatus]